MVTLISDKAAILANMLVIFSKIGKIEIGQEKLDLLEGVISGKSDKKKAFLNKSEDDTIQFIIDNIIDNMLIL